MGNMKRKIAPNYKRITKVGDLFSNGQDAEYHKSLIEKIAEKTDPFLRKQFKKLFRRK